MPPTVHGGRRRRSLTFRGWASVGTPRRRQFGGGALPSCFPRRGLAKVSFRVCFFPSFCRTLNGSKTLHETSTKLLGRGRLSPQLPLSHPNRTDARWTVQKRTRPTFERQSPQFLCLYDCPSLLFARTSRFLDLYSRFYADLSIYARIYAKLKPFITRRGYVRFRRDRC